MFKEDVTQNIYVSWYHTVLLGENNCTPKSLKDFTKEEIFHLIWLLHEELKARGKEE